MKQEQKDLILSWFTHIEELARNRKNANGFVMDNEEVLDEITVLAKDSQEYIMYNL